MSHGARNLFLSMLAMSELIDFSTMIGTRSGYFVRILLLSFTRFSNECFSLNVSGIDNISKKLKSLNTQINNHKEQC